MATSIDGPWSSLSKSQQQKLRRKQLRTQHTLMRHEGIETVHQCTKNIFVGNGGLGNGIQREDLQHIFAQFGKISQILMIERKPYGFVCFEEVKESQNAFNQLQGKTFRFHKETGNEVTLYLSYVEKVPVQLSTNKSLPPGLLIIEDFITMEMEKRLLESIEWESDEERAQTEEKVLKHRRVKHYGYEFRYDINNVDKDKPLPCGIPALCNDVIEEIMQTGHVTQRPDQITVNQYQPGQGIPPHIDTHSAFEDEIISLSLGSEVVMDFKHPNGQHIPVVVPQRSLLVMTGESRYLWTHGITPRKHDVVPADHMTSHDAEESALTLHKRSMRTSFTFRAIKHKPCQCGYPTQCDSQQSKSPDNDKLLPKSEQEAENLEKLHVHEVYDVIAEHFSGTRHSPWPKVAEFLNQQPDGAILADIGCGNGKYLGVNKMLFEIGCDRSVNLIDICNQRGFEAFVCDALAVPLRSDSCDVVISIAVIHHLSTQERRLQAVREIVRILRRGGQALIYVWAMEQVRYKVKSKYLKGSKKTNVEISMATNDGDTGSITKSSAHESKDVKPNKVGNISSEQGLRDDKGVETQKHQYSAKVCGRSDMDCNSSSNVLSENISASPHKITMAKTDTSEELATMTKNVTLKESPVAQTQNSQETSVVKTESSAVTPVANPETSKGTPAPVTNTGNSSTLPVHINRTAFEKQDLLVPWHLKDKGGKKSEDKKLDNPEKDENTGDVKGCHGDGAKSGVFHRFYHVFKEGELQNLCLQCSNVSVIKSYYDQGNWCVILEKV